MLLKFRRIIFIVLFVLYIAELLAVTLFFPGRRDDKIYQHYFIPSQGTIALINNPAQYDIEDYWGYFATGLAGNFLLLLPLSFFLRYFTRLKNSTIVLIAISTSISIEVLQLLLNAGVCDIDDVILNSAGAFVGIYVFNFLNKLFKIKQL